MIVELIKGEYFDLGEKYYITFKYADKEQEEKVYFLFDGFLNPNYGQNSKRAKEGEDYMIPYLADKEGNLTTEKVTRVGGTSVPEDLLSELIRSLIDVYDATIIIGNEEMKGTFDKNVFDELVEKLD